MTETNSTRRMLGSSVLDAAISRYIAVMEQGHRVVVSVSGGKDSTCAMETALIAAELTGYGPVDVVTRDEEILAPGTFEYLERVAVRPEVRMWWLVAHQPIINAFNREQPYWWAFDTALDPSEWVREPPSFAIEIPEINIVSIVTRSRFPTDEGRDLYCSLGLRADESVGRRYGVASAGGHITKPNFEGVRGIRPIYDWMDGDVWRAIGENVWDYNHAYDVFFRRGMPRRRLRIGPPSLNPAGFDTLRILAGAWPHWYDRVCERLPGMRAAAQFGKRVVAADRRAGESWQTTFERECIERAPGWIAERATLARDKMLRAHSRHATAPFPQVRAARCGTCHGDSGSWENLTRNLYLGDPFSMKLTMLPYVEPEYFRPGSGRWGGKPSF